MRLHRPDHPLYVAILAIPGRAPSSALIAADAFPARYAFSPRVAFEQLPGFRTRVWFGVRPLPIYGALACDAAHYRPITDIWSSLQRKRALPRQFLFRAYRGLRIDA